MIFRKEGRALHKELDREQRLLLSLLGQELRGEAPREELVPKELDWQKLAEEARQQTVALQTFNAAAAYKKQIPEQVYRDWLELGGRLLSSNFRVLRAQDELTALLEGNGFPYAILKGTAAAGYYPRPGDRSSGDVDFLILPEHKEKISRLLLAAGYRPDPGEHICHVVFRKPGAHLEMHFEVAGIPNGQAGERVRSYMAGALDKTQRRRVEASEFNAPTDLYHGLILLLHMQHHMLGEGFGLRHLCDWAAYVAASHNMDFWQERLIPILREIGLYRYACIMTQTCVTYLGISSPRWLESVPDELCFRVIWQIFAGGNFGGKDKEQAQARSLAFDRGKNGTQSGLIRNLCDTLSRTAEANYPICKRVKVLKPFLMAYRGLRYSCRAALGKRVGVGKIMKAAEENEGFFQQLRLFEREVE